MKLIMMRPSYRPELSGGTHLAVDLVSDFIARGHEVVVVAPISEKYKPFVDESTDECTIIRISSRFKRNNILSRIMRYIDISVKMYQAAKKVSDADLLMTHSMPPLLGPLGAYLGKKKHLPVLFWEQDVVSESLNSTGIFGKRNLVAKILHGCTQKLEKYSEKNSTYIITISKQFQKMHTDRGVAPEKISVVYNWIDPVQIYPVKREQNPLFDELHIPKDKFIVSYCGNLGVPQNVEIMVDAAEILKEYENILFVIIGGGSRENIIRKYTEEKHLKNVLLFPMQPLERSHYVYSVGDVGLIIGRAGTSKNGFPSKTWSIMAAGQAVISCFDMGSELCGFIREGECGLTVPPDSSTNLADAILQLYQNPQQTNRYGANALRYVREKFNRKTSTGKIVQIAENLYGE